MNAILAEPLEHLCPRFPLWAIPSDGRPWPLLDRHIWDILSLPCTRRHRLGVFYQAYVDRYLGGTGMLAWGFSDMPPEVARALRGGEMRTLQQLAGWVDIRFRLDGTLESTAGCDGWRYLYDEEGKGILATQFLNGPIEAVSQ